MIDITKQRFGKLTVIAYAKASKWLCSCDCGKQVIVENYYLKTGRVKSCGCTKSNHLQSYNDAKFIDITGQKFGKLLVLSRTKPVRKGAIWLCLCDCGKQIITTGGSLRSGSTKSCGCLIQTEDLTGKKFGKLLVLSRHIKHGVKTKILWNCLCDCGNTAIAASGGLKNGSRKSCGCLKKYKDETLNSQHVLFYKYKKSAEKRNLHFALNFDDFIKTVQQNCYYCGKAPQQKLKHPDFRKSFVFNGLDRSNNKEGYTTNNVKPCCKDCNYLKWDRNEDEFISWLEKCHNNPTINTATTPTIQASSSKRAFALYIIYKKSCAQKRGYSFEITFEEFVNLTQQNCQYCGAPPSCNHKGFLFNGLDRIDNNAGYTIDNVITCCRDCNSAKMNLTKEVFIDRIKRCYKHITRSPVLQGHLPSQTRVL